MGLSADLISQFVKVTKNETKPKNETTVYGTAVKDGDSLYVHIDGSPTDVLTPISNTTSVNNGDRVSVLIKNHTAIVTGNLTHPSVSDGDVLVRVNEKISEFDSILANKIGTAELNAEVGRIETLISDTLIANTALFDELKAVDAEITGRLEATEASIDSLNATYAGIDDLFADVANIETLIFGSATGNVIHSSFSNAVIAQLGNAQIKSAMIDSVSAAKITAGDIITNNVRVMSSDGKLLISDETIQISDANRVRVQIGKDSENDYTITILDKDGNVMFSKGGITDKAITSAIIRNDMVSETANIAASKLDIDSLFEEINGSSKTINASKIYVSGADKTVDVYFSTIRTDLVGLNHKITSQGTQISAIEGQISSKIWEQDCVTKSTFNATMGTCNDQINILSTRYSSLEQDVSGFKTTVSDTYATKTQMSTVEQTIDGLTVQVSGIEVGGRNILLNASFKGVSNTQYIVFNSSERMLTCTSSELKRTYTVSRSLSSYGISRLRGTKVTMSGEYMVESDLTYGTTNPWLGMELSVQRDSTTGGSSQWLDWLGSNPNIDKTASGKWTKVSATFLVSDFGTSVNPSIAIVFRDFIGTIKFRNLKVEFGNRATDWTPAPEDIDNDIVNASKTATNYLNFSSAGLVIGDMTASTLGKNILIDSDSVDIRSGTSVRASFGEDYLYLAKHSRNAKIDLCNGLATLYHQSKYSYDTLFVIDTPNATEIMGTYNPLYVTSTVTGKVAIQFSNVNGRLGSIGMVESASGAMITRNVPSTASTYTVLDTGNYYTMMDSGWLTCAINTSGDFTIYSDSDNIKYRKIGKMVEVVGAVKPKKALAGGTTNYIFATLPSGYRPSYAFCERCQGSGGYSWLFSITTGGDLRYSRYSNGSACVDLPAATWLPFHVTFFTN